MAPGDGPYRRDGVGEVLERRLVDHLPVEDDRAGALAFDPVAHPGADESVTVAGNPIKMTETLPAVDRWAPLLDEHREELLDSAPSGGEESERAHSD